MASKIDRIANLLASGQKPAIIAKIVAVSPSYISQLMADPDFSAHVESLKAESLDLDSTEAEEEQTLKDKYLGAEHKIVDHILSRLDMMQDGHAIAALAKIGERRDALAKQQMIKQLPIAGQGQATMRIVELSMPVSAVPEMVIGKNGEIISIAGRAIAPMPVQTLQRMIENETYDSL